MRPKVKWASAHKHNHHFQQVIEFLSPSNTVPFDLFIKHVMYSMGDEFTSFMQSQIARRSSTERERGSSHCSSDNKELLVSKTIWSPQTFATNDNKLRILLQAGQKESRLCTILNRIPSYKKSAKNYLDKKIVS